MKTYEQFVSQIPESYNSLTQSQLNSARDIKRRLGKEAYLQYLAGLDKRSNRYLPPEQRHARAIETISKPQKRRRGEVLRWDREKQSWVSNLEESTNSQFYSSKDSLLKAHGGKLPEGHRPGYRAGKGWFPSSIEDEKKAKKRREARKNPLTKSDFHNYAKRNLINNPKEFADIAAHRESRGISQKEAEKARKKEKFGIEYHVDHTQPLSQEQRKKHRRPRFYAVTPGHSNQNLNVTTKASNIRKGDTPPRRGEYGSNFTRSGAIRHTANDTKKFIGKLDSLIHSVRVSPAKRMERAAKRIGITHD